MKPRFRLLLVRYRVLPRVIIAVLFVLNIWVWCKVSCMIF